MSHFNICVITIDGKVTHITSSRSPQFDHTRKEIKVTDFGGDIDWLFNMNHVISVQVQEVQP